MTSIESKTLPSVTTERHPLLGNRLALAGVVIYFLEWVGIAAGAECARGETLNGS